MITPTNVHYFLAIVDNGSLSGAAGALGVSQPTLSQQLASLERHLGQKLLLRTTAGVAVTEAGRIFYRHARTLAAQIERAESEVGRAGESGEGHVLLGLATCGAASTLALPMLRCMLAKHPSIRLRLNDNFAGTLSDFIMTGRLDLALAYATVPMQGVHCRDLFTEELVLVTAQEFSPGKSQQTPVPLAILREQPAVLLSPIHLLRTVVDRACARAGFALRVVAEIDSLAALQEAVAAGIGTTILPRVAVSTAQPGLAVYRIGPEPLEVTVSLCTSAQLPMTASITLVEALMVELVERHLAAGSWAGVKRCTV